MALHIESHRPADARRDALEADVRDGLGAMPKWLSPVWFYDERGSQLFEEITRLPEYYLTRAERSILDASANAIAATADCSTLVELGSGSSEKTRLLLDALGEAGLLAHYVALDVSQEILVTSAESIHRAYDVDVTAVVADFISQLHCVPGEGRRLFTFLGSTIGNFDPTGRRDFLNRLAGSMNPDDRFLLGVDLVKNVDRMVAAYNDDAGVTAEFNRNVLRVINRELDADFDPDGFAHRAVWDEENRWIEMRLTAREEHEVVLAGLNLAVKFGSGESLRTEVSTKFDDEALRGELAGCGLSTEEVWRDAGGDFQLLLARPS